MRSDQRLAVPTAIAPQADFSDLRFSRSATGHVHSCWWTYDWRKYDPGSLSPYMIGSRFHQIKELSMAAFASALGLRMDDVLVHERRDPVSGLREWRIGTISPCALPVPKLDQRARLLALERLVGEAERPAIDI